MEPTREIYWNVAGLSQAAMYLLLALPAFFLAYGTSRRYLMWRRGREFGPVDRLGTRLKTVLAVALLHRRILRPGYLYAGLMHLFLFWGFAGLFLGTLAILLQADLVGPYFGIDFLQGGFYVFFKLALNLFGLLFVAGLLMALYRRYLQGLPKFRSSMTDDAVVLWTLLALGLTGFLLQALRLAGTADPYGPIHWVSYPLSLVLVGLDHGTLQAAHTGIWWFHMVVTMLFLAYVAFSKMFHIFGGPVNLFLRATDSKTALAPILNIEEQENFGAARLADFNWKQLINMDACMRCARCLDYCPTYNSGKPLMPRQFILEVAAHMATTGGIFIGLGGSLPVEVGMRGREWSRGNGCTAGGPSSQIRLVGDVVSEEEIWDCTTCRACMEQCPVMIEHVPLIVEMRRHLVMERSSFPSELVNVFNSLERRGNPYRMPTNGRTDWARGLEVPEVAEMEDPAQLEVLYWVGCTASYESRSQKVARAFARILKTAGVRFALLGNDELCCGDPARRSGAEHLYQLLAQQNVELLNSFGPRRIVTTCPHCLNTLKNEYPQFGGNYQVVHHSQFLLERLLSGRLQLRGDHNLGVLTYHDPCYLGRYNDVYDAPRQILRRVNGGMVEMPRSRDRSFCCGAGGAHAFMDERRGTRISHGRVKEALSTGAGAVIAACPFCVINLEDGVRALEAEEQFGVRDLAEAIAATLDG